LSNYDVEEVVRVIDELLAKGSVLENLVEIGEYDVKYLDGIEFETWAANAIFYLERTEPESSLTKKAIEANQQVQGNKYPVYLTILGTLRGIEGIHKSEKENARKI
jgi:hypothetical protein